MSLFLLRPHVIGPEGNVTSPDVIVDKVFVDGKATPLGLLTHDAWQTGVATETGMPAYAIMALGGGALMLPTVVLGSGMIVVSRQAWRLNNLNPHVGDVTLNGVKLSEVGLPENAIRSAGGIDDTLPRGYLLVQTATGASLWAQLTDPHLQRELTHKVVVQDITQDTWGALRPKPRYSVGPTMKEVPHFI